MSLRSSVRNSEFLLAEEVVDNQVQAGCLVAGKDIHCCCVGIQTRIFPYDPWDLEDRLERVETKFVRACAEVGRSSTKLCIQKCSKQRTEIGTRMCYVPMTKDNKPRLSQDFEDWDSHIKNNRKAVTKSFAERMKCFIEPGRWDTQSAPTRPTSTYTFAQLQVTLQFASQTEQNRTYTAGGITIASE